MPTVDDRWEPGAQILQQDLWAGQLITARPVIVVQDQPEFLALYTPPHSPYMTAAMGGRRYCLSLEDRVERMMSSGPKPFEERSSGKNHVLTLTPPDQRHSFWLFWGDDWKFAGRFVNLQHPIRRTSVGIVVQDMTLDIRIEPDGSWAWKDEDEFALMHEKGFYSDEEAEWVRAEGERVVEVIEAEGPPFSDGWERWRPPDDWEVPEIPPDWDVVGP